MTSEASLRPIVLVGAARSGTKAFRDALAIASGIPAVPYDVSYVWRHGNESMPHDRQMPADVKASTRRMVDSFLRRYAVDGRVIEKTVGSSLRVGYVHEIVPNANFVHLVRDGVDVAESARRQWLEPVNYSYLRDKIRHFPPRLLATYGRRYAMSLVRQRTSEDGRSASWGPRYPGIDADVASVDLLAICARQWRASVSLARDDFADFSIDHLEVRYEDLVREPGAVLERVIRASDLPIDEAAIAAGAATVRPGAGAAGRLTEAECEMLNGEIGDLLVELGYSRPHSDGSKTNG